MGPVERWTITWASKVKVDGIRRVSLTGPELIIGWGDDVVEVVRASDYEGAVELLRDVAVSGVSWDEPRIGYVEVQIDRATWDELAAYREASS